MISKEENKMLTQVGAGTPGGELLRRYWHPIAATTDLERNATKRVRLLGEDLVLFRDLSGTLGLVEPQCAHRRVDLFYGIPQAHGIRCPYHGWMYDERGFCTEQPYEQAVHPDSFRESQMLKSYPVEALGGLIWAYLGPLPAPLVPRWEPLVRDNSLRDVGVTVIPCNWLQIMENSLDPVHTEWLHGHFTNYALERQGKTDKIQGRFGHEKVGFDLFEHGIVKRRVTAGLSQGDPEWDRGHPILFPSTLLVGALDAANFQFRVPMDDEHTLHFFYTVNTPGVPVPLQEHPVMFHIPVPTEDEWGVPQWQYLDTAPGQDMVAWVTQGAIARREKERLAASDAGVLLYRKLLSDNIKKVQAGEEPMNTFRDPAQNVSIELKTERDRAGVPGGPAAKYSPMIGELRELFEQAKQSLGAPA
jgi:5,5'-dehydrodivanillate O-demethylase oxygenase subunit